MYSTLPKKKKKKKEKSNELITLLEQLEKCLPKEPKKKEQWNNCEQSKEIDVVLLNSSQICAVMKNAIDRLKELWRHFDFKKDLFEFWIGLFPPTEMHFDSVEWTPFVETVTTKYGKLESFDKQAIIQNLSENNCSVLSLRVFDLLSKRFSTVENLINHIVQITQKNLSANSVSTIPVLETRVRWNSEFKKKWQQTRSMTMYDEPMQMDVHHNASSSTIQHSRSQSRSQLRKITAYDSMTNGNTTNVVLDNEREEWMRTLTILQQQVQTLQVQNYQLNRACKEYACGKELDKRQIDHLFYVVNCYELSEKSIPIVAGRCHALQQTIQNKATEENSVETIHNELTQNHKTLENALEQYHALVSQNLAHPVESLSAAFEQIKHCLHTFDQTIQSNAQTQNNWSTLFKQCCSELGGIAQHLKSTVKSITTLSMLPMQIISTPPANDSFVQRDRASVVVEHTNHSHNSNDDTQTQSQVHVNVNMDKIDSEKPMLAAMIRSQTKAKSKEKAKHHHLGSGQIPRARTIDSDHGTESTTKEGVHVGADNDGTHTNSAQSAAGESTNRRHSIHTAKEYRKEHYPELANEESEEDGGDDGDIVETSTVHMMDDNRFLSTTADSEADTPRRANASVAIPSTDNAGDEATPKEATETQVAASTTVQHYQVDSPRSVRSGDDGTRAKLPIETTKKHNRVKTTGNLFRERMHQFGNAESEEEDAISTLSGVPPYNNEDGLDMVEEHENEAIGKDADTSPISPIDPRMPPSQHTQATGNTLTKANLNNNTSPITPLHLKSRSYRFPSSQSVFSVVDFSSLPLPSSDSIAGDDEEQDYQNLDEPDDDDDNEYPARSSQANKRGSVIKETTTLKKLRERLNEAFVAVDILGEGTVDIANFCTAMMDLGLYDFDFSNGQDIFDVLDKNGMQSIPITEAIDALVLSTEHAPVNTLRVKIMEMLGLHDNEPPEEPVAAEDQKVEKVPKKKKKPRNNESRFDVLSEFFCFCVALYRDAMEELRYVAPEKDKTPLSPVYKGAQVVQKLDLNEIQNKN
ncbi:hypothetical protein RFI_21226 [Reticulomyxa filosa]|uniref:EF-hand domain-containing protein n=1 Tax=Reticulomyxa filosa TaxID=46433 RepID=X6MRQ2_RETFI|nr:hypothetical protein RFI_21226 [Reticulomyxa filosa]|eukprot:ETO16132.1 hypothetical protein RFI_21226 [Reticulomyxa filosa]